MEISKSLCFDKNYDHIVSFWTSKATELSSVASLLQFESHIDVTSARGSGHVMGFCLKIRLICIHDSDVAGCRIMTEK